MDLFQAMQARHSVRQYQPRPIEEEKRRQLNDAVRRINQDTGLNIQIFYDEPNCFNSMMAHYGKFSGVENYICLVGRRAPALEETLGYYGEALVLQAQQLGLNTCWVAMTHGRSRAKLGAGEKQVCLISLGYGAVQGVPHKSRPAAEVSAAPAPAPDWFTRGVQAALLAPTAMNQQKFRLTLNADGSVSAAAGSGFYTKLDLGIVKYHFEAASGRKIG